MPGALTFAITSVGSKCRRSSRSRLKLRSQSQGDELAAAEERVAAIAQERAERLAAVNSLDAELRATRNSLNELHDARGKEQVRQTQLQLRVDNLLEHVTRRYQLDLREVHVATTTRFRKRSVRS